MRLLKRIFGWNSGQDALINQKPIAPQFTSEEEGQEEEEDILASSEIREDRLEAVEETPTKTEVKLGRKTYIVEDLTPADIKKLRQDWGARKLKSLGIIK